MTFEHMTLKILKVLLTIFGLLVTTTIDLLTSKSNLVHLCSQLHLRRKLVKLPQTVCKTMC